MGRTGRFLASSHTGVRADIYTLSKALGGGIAKIAATMVRASHFDQEFGLVHSSTFAEDGFSTAVAQAVLDQLEADDGAFYAQVRARGQSLLAGLEGLRQCYGTVIADVRGQGLMLAVEFHDQAQASSIIFRSAAHTDAFGYFVAGYLLREHGIRVAPTGSSPNTIRIQPPALIDDRQIAQVLAGFQQLCQIISRQDTYHLAHAMAAAGPGPARKVRHHVQDFRHQFSEQPPAAIGRASRRVAFINHLITPEWLGVADPSMADLTPEEQRRFVLKLEANKVVAPFPPVRVVSATGSSIDFMIYPLCVCSEQMAGWLASGNLEGIREDVQKRIEVARADGCEIAGLGMYTSIVTNNCLSVSVPGMGLTSGNALTVAMGLEAIERAVAQTGRDPQTMTVALVGAAGNIAATYASLLAPWAGRVLLFGSTREGSRMRLERTRQGLYADLWHDIQVGQHHPKNPLARAVSAVCGADHAVTGGPAIAEAIGRYYGGQDPHCHIADDLAMVAEADVVVCMANADRPFLDARHFRPGAIVCDLAVPNNVVAGLAEARPDLQLFAGGIVATPHGESLHPAARAGLSQGQVYACMAETMVLGLAGRSGHFSYGSLGRSQVREIAGLAAQHGFRLAGFKHDRSL
jgi:predicted amino acid dehydrogenase